MLEQLLENKLDMLIDAVQENTQVLRDMMSGQSSPTVVTLESTTDVVDESVTTNATDMPSVVPTTIDDVPPVDQRPYPTEPLKRKAKKVSEYEKAVEAGDPAAIATAELAMNNYHLTTAKRNQKRVTNIQTETVAEAKDRELALTYANIEVAHYQTLVDNAGAAVPATNETTSAAPTAPGAPAAPTAPGAPAAPTAPGAPAAPEAQLVVDPRGAPAGFMMTDHGDQSLTYESYMLQNWSDQQLIDGNLMKEIPEGAITTEQAASNITIQNVRDMMMNLTASKPHCSDALIGCMTALGASVVEDVAVTDYPKLMSDMQATHDAMQ